MKKLLFLIAAATLIAGCGAAAQPSAAATRAPTAHASPSASAAHITAAQNAQVQTILQAAMDHYTTAYAAGQSALGTTRYADASAGLAAFNDPNSAASKFRDWRHSSGIEADAKTYLDAFKKADAFYNADNEPAAITDWMNDLGTEQGDIGQWVQVAVSWQITEKSDADLAAAAAKVNQDFSTVRSDLAQVLAQS